MWGRCYGHKVGKRVLHKKGGKPDVNVRPGDGSSSGSGSSGAGSSGSGSGSGSGSSGSGSESGSGSGGDGSGGGGGDSGGGSSGGGDSGGGSSSDKGSGHPDTWLEKEDYDDLDRDSWNFFDPFKQQYEPFAWDKGYDPLEGYEPGRMPDFPQAGNPNYGAKDPFDIPNDIKFKDFVIEFEKEG